MNTDNNDLTIISSTKIIEIKAIKAFYINLIF